MAALGRVYLQEEWSIVTFVCAWFVHHAVCFPACRFSVLHRLRPALRHSSAVWYLWELLMYRVVPPWNFIMKSDSAVRPTHVTLSVCAHSVIDLHKRKWVYLCDGNCAMIKAKGLDWGQRREWKCKSYWDEDEPVRKDSWSFMSCSILGQSLHWHWKEVIITGPIVICTTILIWTAQCTDLSLI